jgi:acylphosphatase
MKTVTIIVTGHVQGVIFRDFAVFSALKVGVTGWVRNRRDGSVEARATGTEDALARFIAAMQAGSPASRVDNVHVEDSELELLTGFTRRGTV